MRELSQQERIWDLKTPIYMALAEEFEELFISEDKEIDAKARVKSFNKLYNKLFIVGNDDIIKQLNETDNTNTREYIKKAMILLRKELNKGTKLEAVDYIRKKLEKK